MNKTILFMSLAGFMESTGGFLDHALKIVTLQG